MTAPTEFDRAVEVLDVGDIDALRKLLQATPELAVARDQGGATLMIRLIDYPGRRPRGGESARLLLEAGADPETRRNAENGTAMGGALCTFDVDIIRVLLEFGADIHAPLGWMEGTHLEYADRICQDLARQHDDEIVALKELFSKAAGRPVANRTPVGGVVPLLFVEDVEAGTKFYTEKLGFFVNWTYDEAPPGSAYLSISRGGAEFHLTKCLCEDRRHAGNLWVRVECGPVDPLFEEIRAAGVNIRSEPVNQPYGFREFEIEDPDGNRLIFYGPLTEHENGE